MIVRVYCFINDKLAAFDVEAETYDEAIAYVKEETKQNTGLALV